jgi:DNA replication and repair protein RecF
LFLHELELQQFRCFSDKKISFNKQITFITGDNGTGKTSLLEAIHYLCYFKSFRSHIVQDVIHTGSASFFLKGSFARKHDFENAQHQLQVGYFQRKKSIKLDQRAVTSHKQVFPYFQVLTLTEDDIDLIKGYPAVRRAFVDQAVLFSKPDSFDEYSKFRQIVQNRNALLGSYGPIDSVELETWDHALWEQSSKIQNHRKSALEMIEKAVNVLIDDYFEGIYQVRLQYDPKVVCDGIDFDAFRSKIDSFLPQERILKRSLFGAHLDDLSIHIHGKKARIYASRGQQKLISLLCKVSWASMASNEQEYPILLIDDFISDFDQKRLSQLINFFVSCKNQIILTAPFYDSALKEFLQKSDPDIISL